jgi:hemoglobin
MTNAAPADDQTPSTLNPYEAMGGEAGVRRLVDRFYHIMDTDPAAAAIRAMHGADLNPMRQKLFEFMSGWLGGPRLYNSCIMSAHRPYTIGTAERDQWLMCMRQAMAEAEVSPAVQTLLEKPLSSMADFMRSRPATAH